MAAPTASPFSERVMGTVNQEILPTLSDAIFDGSVLMQRLLVGGVKPWTGGPQMWKSILVKKSSQGGSFSGMQKFDSSAEENTIRVAFDPKGVEQPVVIPGIEESVNMTKAGQIRLLTQKLEESSFNLRDRLTTMLFSDGTGNNGKDLTGLKSHVDDGTVATNHGGQSRTTYPSLNSNVVDVNGNLTLAHMATQTTATDSSGGPRTKSTMIVCAEDVFTYYEKLLTPTVQYNMPSIGMQQLFASGPMKPAGEFGMNQGFNALSWRGKPVVADEGCPDGEMYFLNENDLAFYNLKGARLESSPVQGGNVHDDSPYTGAPSTSTVQFMPFQMPESQYGVVGHLILLGELIVWNPKRHARSTRITGA